MLDDVSPKARAANTVRAKAMLADLSTFIHYKKLSRSARVELEDESARLEAFISG